MCDRGLWHDQELSAHEQDCFGRDGVSGAEGQAFGAVVVIDDAYRHQGAATPSQVRRSALNCGRVMTSSAPSRRWISIVR